MKSTILYAISDARDKCGSLGYKASAAFNEVVRPADGKRQLLKSGRPTATCLFANPTSLIGLLA
jgi:hypothetical protein